ncbi:hypothetical protein G5B39_13800 (plasmid) [Rhodobacteraceae bacterium SC52]|nr:hypothetical protein G5B39_13800 [Rhodobacteraceae bacterium SC52]
MFKTLISATVSKNTPVIGRVRAAYDEWRFSRDITAIMSALDRLSNHQLHLVGIRRDDLFETVAEMMRRAEAQRVVGREVTNMLDRPTTATQPAKEAKPSETARPAATSVAA